MFLLHTQNNKTKKIYLLEIIHLKNLIRKTIKQINLLKQLKKNKEFKKLRLILSKINSYNFKSQSLIKYIFGICIYNTNIIVYLSDIKGRVKFFCSAGSLGIKRKQKKQKIAVLIKLIKFTIFRVKFLYKKDLIALHLKNFNEYLGSFISCFLAKYYNLELIKINNNQPHNGCRPRKIKRKKRKKLSF